MYHAFITIVTLSPLSFDFSLPPSPNSLHYPVEPPEPLPLCPEDTARSIESWRDDVVLSIAGPGSRLSGDDNNEPHDLPRGIKRHRSSTFSDGDRDEDEQARRVHISHAPLYWLPDCH